MAAKEPRSKQESSAYGLAEIRMLARIVNQFDLSEVEVDHGGQRIRLRRERGGAAPTMVSVAAPALPQAIAAPVAAPAATAAEAPSDGTSLITTPFVGTFYRAPAPGANPFVEAGQTVKKGQVLCIVEAMKLMNEIEAEADCKIVDILVKNAEPVEYGQALFKILPLA